MKKIILPLVALTIGFTACDSYLDINTNPNAPVEESLTNEVIFPGAELNLANGYGNYLRTLGGYYSQQYAHMFGTSNYLDFSQFITSQVRSNRTYSQMNTLLLKNLETIRDNATEEEDWGAYLAATTLRVFAIQALVDAYGEIPYTEALNADILSPKYDEGNVIYSGILTELNEAMAKITDPSVPVAATFLLGESATANDWLQFANALKLRILMRMSNVQDVDADVASLLAEDNFPATDIAYTGIWANETGKANPFYQEEFASYFGSTQRNVSLNLALSSAMEDSNDARLQVFFDENADGEYKGGVSGTNFSTSKVYQSTYFNRPTIKYNSPVYLITKAETAFFMAEYYASKGASVDAKTYYEEAITESFLSAGLSAADAEKVYTGKYAYDNANYKRLIGIQKWVALSGTNNFEAWCELRRLKYPAFGTVSGDDIYDAASDTFQPQLLVPGTLYTPINVFGELGDRTLLQRIRYAQNSTNANTNAPAVKPDTEPVFWAK